MPEWLALGHSLLRGASRLLTNSKVANAVRSKEVARTPPRSQSRGRRKRLPLASVFPPPTSTASVPRDANQPFLPTTRSRVTKSAEPHTPSPGVPRAALRGPAPPAEHPLPERLRGPRCMLGVEVSAEAARRVGQSSARGRKRKRPTACARSRLRPAPLIPVLSLTCLSAELLHPVAGRAAGSIASRGTEWSLSGTRSPSSRRRHGE